MHSFGEDYAYCWSLFLVQHGERELKCFSIVGWALWIEYEPDHKKLPFYLRDLIFAQHLFSDYNVNPGGQKLYLFFFTTAGSGPKHCIGSIHVCCIHEHRVQWSVGFSSVLSVCGREKSGSSKKRGINPRLSLPFLWPLGKWKTVKKMGLDPWQIDSWFLQHNFLIQPQQVTFVKTTSYLWLFPHFR